MKNKHWIKLEKEIDKIIKQSRHNIIKNQAAAYKDIQKEITKIYMNYSVDGQLTMDIMKKYGRIDKLDKKIAKTIISMYAANKTITNTTLRNIYDRSYKGSTDAFGVKAIRKDIKITEKVNELVGGISWRNRNDKHRRDLIYKSHGIIKDGLQKGISYEEMAKNIKQTLGKDVEKPIRIARTESHRITSAAKLDALEEIEKTGISIVKKWNSVHDERVRSSHNSLDQVTIPVYEDFISSTGMGLGPGMMGNAADDVNCRCYLTFEKIQTP